MPASRVLVIVLYFLAQVLPVIASAREQDIGAVTARHGDAHLKRPGVDRTISAGIGLLFRVGDVIRTGSIGSCQLALTDESFITLGSSTAVRVNQYSFDEDRNRRTAVVQIIEGTARIVILRPRSAGSRFRVETEIAAIDPDQLVDLVIMATPDNTTVKVLRRSLRVRNRSALYVGEYRIGENQKTTVLKSKAPCSPEALTREERRDLLEPFQHL